MNVVIGNYKYYLIEECVEHDVTVLLIKDLKPRALFYNNLTLVTHLLIVNAETRFVLKMDFNVLFDDITLTWPALVTIIFCTLIIIVTCVTMYNITSIWSNPILPYLNINYSFSRNTQISNKMFTIEDFGQISTTLFFSAFSFIHMCITLHAVSICVLNVDMDKHPNSFK